MKYTILTLLLISILSCRGSKQVADSPKPDTDIVEIATDSIATEENVVETIVETDSINAPEVDTQTAMDSVATKHQNDTPIPVEINEKKANHSLWTNLLQKHVSNEGNVNYKGFKTDRSSLQNYIKHLSDNMPDERWSKNETLAYWINAYNALTVDLILRHYPIKSIKDIKKPWDQRYWKLGNKWHNLNEIEHQILRKMNDPRIHFAIVCASFSCPKLENTAYESANLDTQLTHATKTFINDPKRNTVTPNNLEISKIFSWFSKDFGGSGNIINYINKYADISIPNNTTKRYKTYDWALND